MPFCVLILGTGCGRLLRCALTARREDHEQVLALEERLSFDDRELLRVVRHALEDLPPYLLMDHLAAPEHDRHLDLFYCLEELSQTLEFGLDVMLRDLRPQLHFFLLDDVLLAPLVLLALDGLKLEASVDLHATDRRARLWRHPEV